MLFESIDIYCERTAAGLWAEPLNAISNISFFIAAWMLWRRSRQMPRDPGIHGPILLVAAVGAGSLAFHTFANGLTMLADIIPIGLFVFTYQWVAYRRLFGWTQAKCALALAGFALLAYGASQVPDPYRFNGSVDYFPCLLVLLVIGWRLHAAVHPVAGKFLLAAAVFALSLTFRSVDMLLCPSLEIGVHFLWHLLNGAVLYLLTSIPLNLPRPPAR